MVRRLVILLAAFALLAGAPSVAHADTVTLRVATLAPQASPWGKVFTAWQKGIKSASNGALEIQFFYGNQQGDEVAMVGKMRTRQLDGAAITATGLAQIYKSVLVLQMPGMFRDWGSLDSARKVMRPGLDAEFDKQGFKILGWGDVGIGHMMTKGFEVRTPADLKHRNCFFLTGDPIESTFYQVLGDVNPKQLTVPEILPALTAGTINVVEAPALAAEQLQWSSLLDHLNTAASGIGIGALVFTSSRINSLPADLQKLVIESGNNTGAALTSSIRNQDNLAFARLKGRMSAYEPTGGRGRPVEGALQADPRPPARLDVRPEGVRRSLQAVRQLRVTELTRGALDRAFAETRALRGYGARSTTPRSCRTKLPVPAPAPPPVVPKQKWGEPLVRLDKKWTSLESRLCVWVLPRGDRGALLLDRAEGALLGVHARRRRRLGARVPVAHHVRPVRLRRAQADEAQERQRGRRAQARGSSPRRSSRASSRGASGSRSASSTRRTSSTGFRTPRS